MRYHTFGTLKYERISNSKPMPRRRVLNKKRKSRSGLWIALAIIVIFAISVGIYLIISHYDMPPAPTKPIILYVNQGNGVVNESNFGELVSFSAAKGFNTIFFQVYRSGSLLFNSSELTFFVTSSHAAKLKIFFALYFTNSSQIIPSSIYSLGEDGINLDMSTIDPSVQTALLSTLSSNYGGLTAVTSTNFTTTLKPEWLILETYGDDYQQYIHPGIIASVGVFTTSSEQQYTQEFQYALSNSDGVMVFDYAGLKSSGY
jgi:hypothetical protein